MITVRTPDGVKDVAALSLRTGGVLKAIETASLRTALGLVEVWPVAGGGGALTININTPLVQGAAASDVSPSVTTDQVTATPANGVAPFTYLWELIADDGGVWAIENANVATTRFYHTLVSSGDTYTATFRCTVTDANGFTGETADVTAIVTNYGDPRGYALP